MYQFYDIFRVGRPWCPLLKPFPELVSATSTPTRLLCNIFDTVSVAITGLFLAYLVFFGGIVVIVVVVIVAVIAILLGIIHVVEHHSVDAGV